MRFIKTQIIILLILGLCAVHSSAWADCTDCMKAQLVDVGVVAVIKVKVCGEEGSCAGGSCGTAMGGLSIGHAHVTISSRMDNTLANTGSLTSWQAPEANIGGCWLRVGDRTDWSVGYESGESSYIQGTSGNYTRVAFVATDPDGYKYHFGLNGSWGTQEAAIEAAHAAIPLNTITDSSATPVTLVSFTYDNGKLVTQTSWVTYDTVANGYIKYSYDGSDKLDRVWAGTTLSDFKTPAQGDPDGGRWIDVTYNSNGMLTGIVHGCSGCNMEELSYEYVPSSLGDDYLIEKVLDHDDNVIESYDYDSHDRQTEYWRGDKDDGGDKVTEWDYDSSSSSSHVRRDYGEDNTHYRATRVITDSGGNVIEERRYHDLQSGAELTGPYSVTSYESVRNGGVLELAITTLPKGNKSIQLYNSSGQITERQRSTGVAGDSPVTVMQYSYYDNKVIKTTDTRGGVTDYRYVGNKLTLRVDPDSNNPIESTDQLATQYSYDSKGRVTQECRRYFEGIWGVNIGGGSSLPFPSLGDYIIRTGYQYNDDGDLEKRIDNFDGDFGSTTSGEIVTEYVYNDYHQQIKMISPENVIQGWHYNDAGQLEYEVVYDPTDLDKAYSMTEYTYESGTGRLLYRKMYKSDSSFAISSPPATYIRDGYSYDIYGHKTSEMRDVDGLALETTYDYNHQGEIVKTTTPNGKWQKVERDGRGLTVRQIVGYGQGAGETEVAVTEFEYDVNGNLLVKRDPIVTVDGVQQRAKTVYTYDGYDRMARVKQLVETVEE